MPLQMPQQKQQQMPQNMRQSATATLLQTHRAVIDFEAVRIAARHFDEVDVASCFRCTRENVIALLNGALATELVCTLRYTRHYFTVSGKGNSQIMAKFLQHARDEQLHVFLLAERIVQLKGEPDFSPTSLLTHSHASYDDSVGIQAMIMANLIAERTTIEAYRQMLIVIGDSDPTTTHLLAGMMVTDEHHADEMRKLLR